MMAEALHAFTEPDPDEQDREPQTLPVDDEKRDFVYLAVSSHLSELTETYVKEAVERYKERLAGAEDLDAAIKGPPEKIHLNASLGKAILAGVTEIMFTAAMNASYFRFPDGFGSFRVQRLTKEPKAKRLPTGQMIEMPTQRIKFRYEDGAAVREKLNLTRKTNYVRRYNRVSRLSKRTQELLDQLKPPQED
jgi:hypothetical protein